MMRREIDDVREDPKTGVPALFEGLGNVLYNLIIFGVIVGIAAVAGAFLLGGAISHLVESWFGIPQTKDRAILAGGVIGGVIGLPLWFRASTFWGALFPDMDQSHGSARFADDTEIGSIMHKHEGLLIGLDRETGRFLRYDGKAHLLTLAPTRSGKGVGTIIPNLLKTRHSVIVIDPKGENTRITGQARIDMGPLYVLDPFGISGYPSAAFNPLDMLEPDSLDLGEDAAALADALVVDPPDQVKDAHWNEEAKALIQGLILWGVCHEPEGQRNLGRLRELLTLPHQKFAELLVDMQDSKAAHGLIARAANRHISKPEKEAGSILSNAQRHTHFLDSPRMIEVTKTSHFAFADLRKQTASLFVVLPPDRLDVYARWLRLIVAQGLQDIVRDAQRPSEAVTDALSAPGTPTLFLLDEFASLGRYKIKSHEEGQTTSENVHARDLLTPDEIMRLDPSLQILKVKGLNPVISKRVIYYKDERFSGLF